MLLLLKRPRFLLFLAVLGALLAGAVQLGFAAWRAQAAPLPALGRRHATHIVVAAGALPAGQLITVADVAAQPWLAQKLPQGAVVAGSAAATALIGSVTKHPLAAGEWLTAQSVVRPGDHGFLAAVVAPGRRAIGVAVDATNSAGGLIRPGDHVDVILTQELRDEGVSAAQRVLAETILNDVRILSADQRLAVEGNAATGVPATITLEVSPLQAEQLAVATTLGRLHLALRPVQTETTTQALPTLWAGTVSPGLLAMRKRPQVNYAAAPAPPPVAPPAQSALSRLVDVVPVFRGSTGEQK